MLKNVCFLVICTNTLVCGSPKSWFWDPFLGPCSCLDRGFQGFQVLPDPKITKPGCLYISIMSKFCHFSLPNTLLSILFWTCRFTFFQVLIKKSQKTDIGMWLVQTSKNHGFFRSPTGHLGPLTGHVPSDRNLQKRVFTKQLPLVVNWEIIIWDPKITIFYIF